MKHWLNYFLHNRENRKTIPWGNTMELERDLCGPLIRSLQTFQVGESGEGHHLRKQAALTKDPIYEQTIDLFIKEEQEHARLMAQVLRRLDAPLLKSHWSDNCFILLRRLFRLKEELLVLLIPEMIAKRYFRALHDGTKDSILRAMCEQILHDEEGHVAFHIDFLRRTFAPSSLVSRIVTRIIWRLLFRAACLVVIFDHYKLLRAAGVSPIVFWWDCGLIFDETAASIFSCAPTSVWKATAIQSVPIR